MAPFTKESLLLFVVLGVAFVSLGRTAQSSPDQQNLTREKKYRRKFFLSRQVISSWNFSSVSSSWQHLLFKFLLARKLKTQDFVSWAFQLQWARIFHGQVLVAACRSHSKCWTAKLSYGFRQTSAWLKFSQIMGFYRPMWCAQLWSRHGMCGEIWPIGSMWMRHGMSRGNWRPQKGRDKNRYDILGRPLWILVYESNMKAR